MLGQLKHFLPQISSFLERAERMEQKIDNIQTKPEPTKNYTVREVLESMLKKANNQKAESDRKYHSIEKMLSGVGLSLDVDYMVFYNHDMLTKISDNIMEKQDVKDDTKIKYLRYIQKI